MLCLYLSFYVAFIRLQRSSERIISAMEWTWRCWSLQLTCINLKQMSHTHHLWTGEWRDLWQMLVNMLQLCFNGMIHTSIYMQVKDQGRCGSSWAFSATGAMEGQLYKATRTLTSLSEQQLLDCSMEYNNKGCSGGMASAAYAYVHRFGGICRECDYPYLGYVSVPNFVQ